MNQVAANKPRIQQTTEADTSPPSIDLEIGDVIDDTVQGQVELTIEQIMMDELNLKFKCVIAYLVLMISRIVIALAARQGIIEYYEYITCASAMAAILLMFQLFGRGSNKMATKNIVFLNSFVPIGILMSAIYHLANLRATHFESQEAWAFCVCQIWNINLMIAVFFAMPIRQQLFFAVAGLMATIGNIESESSDANALRYRTYPKFLLFNFILIMVSIQLARLKDAIIKQLSRKNADLFDTQKIILNSMTQGIILCYNDQPKFTPDQAFFLNQSIKSLLESVITHHPEWLQRLNNLKIAQKSNQFDFLKCYDFMKIKMFVQKKADVQDDQQDLLASQTQSMAEVLSVSDKTKDNSSSNGNSSYEKSSNSQPNSNSASAYASASNSNSDSKNSSSKSNQSNDTIERPQDFFDSNHVYSLHDLIILAFTNNDLISRMTFQIELPASVKDSMSEEDNTYFALSIVDNMRMNDRICKMIQFIDISKNVQYDDAIQQKQFASMLNATVSHEMRGPIGSIQQNILVQERQIEEMQNMKEVLKGELAQLEDKGEEESKKLKKAKKIVKKWDKSLKELGHLKANIKTGSKLLGFYVQDLLDLAQMRAGKIVKNIERVNVNEVLSEILQTQEIAGQMKDVSLVLKEFPAQDRMMEIDPQRIQQVALNLLTNAMKFSRTNGSVELGGKVLTIKKQNKICKYVEIYVEDTGYGISKEDKNKLFKLFGKIKQKNGLNKQGIGLGLNICKQICELFDGDIDVDSELGVGSRFFFKFLLSETPILQDENVEFVEKQIDVNDMDIKMEDTNDYTVMRQFEKVDQNNTILNDMTAEKLLLNEAEIDAPIIRKANDPAGSFDDVDVAALENSGKNIDMAKYSKKSGDRMMDDLQDIALSEGCCSDGDEDNSKKYWSNILVADDNPVELKTVIEQVKYIKGPDMKFQTCDFAQDGDTLVEMYNKRLKQAQESKFEISPYTVIITDLHMPGCNGFEAVNKICQQYEKALVNASDKKKQALKPKIVIHSGEKNNILKEQIESTTSMRFLYKPGSIDQIQEIIGPSLQPLQKK